MSKAVFETRDGVPVAVLFEVREGGPSHGHPEPCHYGSGHTGPWRIIRVSRVFDEDDQVVPPDSPLYKEAKEMMRLQLMSGRQVCDAHLEDWHNDVHRKNPDWIIVW